MDDAKHLRSSAGNADRRQFLRRAALVGTTVWAVPTIVTIDVAGSQQMTSPPPTRPPAVGNVTDPRLPAQQTAAQSTPTQVAGRTELPRTGIELNEVAVAGLAATVGGAALVLWSAELER